MPHIHKIGNVNLMCWTPSEADRLPNIPLGKHYRINTNNVLLKDSRLNKYINDRTMGALDNYAHHEGLNIYITPLENDLFHDVAVSAYKDHETVSKFPVKINDGRHALRDFLKELYENIAPRQNKKEQSFAKPTNLDNFKMFAAEVVDNVKNFRINQIRKFIENHQKEGDALKDIADVFEDVHYNELYK